MGTILDPSSHAASSPRGLRWWVKVTPTLNMPERSAVVMSQFRHAIHCRIDEQFWKAGKLTFERQYFDSQSGMGPELQLLHERHDCLIIGYGTNTYDLPASMLHAD